MNNGEHKDVITVEVESVLEPIIPDFLVNRRNDYELITRLLDRDAFDEIRVIGHRMKGAGGSYGFDHISDIGEVVENAALDSDHKTIRAAAKELEEYLEKVSVVYV